MFFPNFMFPTEKRNEHGAQMKVGLEDQKVLYEHLP